MGAGHRLGVRVSSGFQDGEPVELDTRRVLQRALAKLDDAGYGLRCGLEVEFHIYRIRDSAPQLDPERAGWPGLPPDVDLIHPGYNLLTEAWWDMAEKPLRIVQNTAQALGLPLLSLEIELGPSQVEAVFDVTDALTAADNMVLFRRAVKQALLPRGVSRQLHVATAISRTSCRADGTCTSRCGTTRPARARSGASRLPPAVRPLLPGTHFRKSASTISPACWRTRGAWRSSARRLSTASPASSLMRWRRNRCCGDGTIAARRCGSSAPAATTTRRIENRIGEPAANPYLYLASQVHAGLDGIARKLTAPPATDAPYAGSHERLPASLGEGLDALEADPLMRAAFGESFIGYYTRIKRSEMARFEDAKDKLDFQRREYFSRF